MEEIINKLLEENEIIKELKEFPKPTLQIIKLYLENNFIEIREQTKEEKEKNQYTYRAIKTCMPQEYNYLEIMLDCTQNINSGSSKSSYTKQINKKLNVCRNCKLKNCIKDITSDLLFEIQTINQTNNLKINPLDIIKILLQEENTYEKYNDLTDNKLFEEVPIYTLLFVQTIINNKFIKFEKFDEETNKATFKYIDLTKKEGHEFYINKLNSYYNGESYKELQINIDKFEANSKDITDYNYFYKLSAYYLYKMHVKKMNVVGGLNKYLDEKNKEPYKNRSKYFHESQKKKVDALPCNKKTKEAIKSIFNYILNYCYDSNIEYIPMNIVMYTEDTELVKKITEIIGEYMWYFVYLNKDMRYYNKSMNEILINKSELKDLYLIKKDNKVFNKFGMLTIDNFESIMYANSTDKNIILNILSENIEKNNSRVCTIIYGNKENIKSILSSYPKLNTSLFNIELDIDELSIDEVYQMLIDKIELNQKIDDEVKEKIYNYIKLTYGNSELKNTEYMKVLYNKIILKEYSEYKGYKALSMSLEDIPNVYNTRDLPEILSDLNKLVGLDKIKGQINNLISLLKFNKNANIDISKFNLHMIFTGNPGTGKTTVARLLSDILFNLGYIRKNKLVEVSAKDLIAEYIGQTSGKTYNVMKSAFGGVLFIDEAYSIIDTDSKGTYASDCISTILKVMEDQRDNIIVIFAGYGKEMERFIKFNPGLQSRIGYKIEFDDYSIDELLQIFLNLLNDNDFKITDEAKEKVKEIIEKSSKIDNFGNARYINKMYQDILISHAKNTEDYKDDKELKLITENDISDDLIAKEKQHRKIGF